MNGDPRNNFTITLTLGEYGDTASRTFDFNYRALAKGSDKKLSSNILDFLQEHYVYDPDGYLDDEDVEQFYSDEGPSRRRASTRRRGWGEYDEQFALTPTNGNDTLMDISEYDFWDNFEE